MNVAFIKSFSLRMWVLAWTHWKSSVTSVNISKVLWSFNWMYSNSQCLLLSENSHLVMKTIFVPDYCIELMAVTFFWYQRSRVFAKQVMISGYCIYYVWLQNYDVSWTFLFDMYADKQLLSSFQSFSFCLWFNSVITGILILSGWGSATNYTETTEL